jgi:hypothetical protein
MNSLLIKKLYIFSIREKKAISINFSKGKNIITSSRTNGNKLGKSIILKSLYHTLGADCYFEDKWDSDEKIYILNITIKDKIYYFYRLDKLFKIFSSEYELIFKTVSRNELGIFLRDLFDFGVQLPNRKNNRLEITPPVYNYILSFIDQDKMDGTNFNSFKSLQQYSRYKENTLYYHLGLFNEDYYDLINNIDKLKEKENKYLNENDLIDKMLDKISDDIKDDDYSASVEALNLEIDKNKDKYTEVINKLSNTKQELVGLRNNKEKLLSSINELDLLIKDNKNDLSKIRKYNCPTCNSEIKDMISLKVEKCNEIEDYLYLSSQLDKDVEKVEQEIKKYEKVYTDNLEILNKYDDQLNIKHGEINDLIVKRGYIAFKEKLLNNEFDIKDKLKKINVRKKELNLKKRKYSNLKKRINKKYYEIMLEDKMKFNLKEIKNKSFENVTSTFTAGGSSKPISTIIWYINLQKIKNIYNPNVIKFPMVLDSPNNVEIDDEKKKELFNYLFNIINTETQLIVSTLGFEKDDYEDIKFENVIKLENNKYELLNNEDYLKHKDLVDLFMKK